MSHASRCGASTGPWVTVPGMRTSHVVAIAAFLTTSLAAAPNLANSGGAPGVCTNEPNEVCGAGPAFCTRCHFGNNGPAPTVTVTGLSASYEPGESALFSVVVHTNDSTGGAPSTSCAASRCAGFQMSTDTAGRFTIVSGSGTKLATNAGSLDIDNVVTHSARKAFTSDDATFPVQLDALQPGHHTLFIAEVVYAQAEEEAFDTTYLLRERDLKPLHHLGGDRYATLDDVLTSDAPLPSD